MKAKLPWLCVVLLTVWGDSALAEQPRGDPIHGLLIPPEVLMQHRVELRLTDEQVEQMRTRLEKARPEMQEVQQRANKAMGRLAELLSADRVDEGAALKQLDKILTIEKDQKRLHLRIMIQIRNGLTAEQRRAAAKIGPTATSNEGLEQRLKAKPENEPANRKEEARSPTADPKRSALGRSAAAVLDDFYRPDEVQSIYLRVAKKNMQRMLAALPKRIYVPASFRWRDVSVEKVAIRFKGNSSSHPNQRHKRSFLIKFSKYDDDRRFFGLRRVSFDNGIQFGSLFSEPIITDILRSHGVKTHRCNYARIYLNKEYRGVYVNVERIDESFIEHHLPDANGSLFKVDMGGPGANLQFLGDDPSAYKRAFEAKTETAKKEPARLVEFIRLINRSEKSDFAAILESKLELDDFLRVTAVMLLSGAFDQLTGWNPHNYYLYHDAKHDRWRYLPWDLDVGFCEIAFGHVHVLADWNAAWPVATSGGPNPLLERIIADPMLLQRYRRAARTILDKSFEPERLCKIIDAKYELIKQDLKADPFPHRRATVPGDRSYDDIVESIKGFVRKRYASALQQLENPGSRPKTVRRPRRGRPGGLPPQLARRIQRIHQRAREMQQDGRDISPVRKLMDKVGPLLQQGKLAEAERAINEALKLVGERPSKPE